MGIHPMLAREVVPEGRAEFPLVNLERSELRSLAELLEGKVNLVQYVLRRGYFC